MYMLAAALIPLIFIAGLLVLFLVLGAWEVAILPTIVIVALLVGVAFVLVRMMSQMDRPNRAH
jgi:hypothetical protein